MLMSLDRQQRLVPFFTGINFHFSAFSHTHTHERTHARTPVSVKKFVVDMLLKVSYAQEGCIFIILFKNKVQTVIL